MPEATEDPIAPPTPDEAILPQERRFRVGDREIVVRPLVIGEIKRIAEDLGRLAQQVAREHPEIDFAKPDEHLEALFPIISLSIGRLFERLFGIEEAYLDEYLTLTQTTEILVAVLEVNQLPALLKNVSRARQLAKQMPTIR